MPKHIEIRYYESFAKTHQGHGTDVAIVGGAMGHTLSIVELNHP